MRIGFAIYWLAVVSTAICFADEPAPLSCHTDYDEAYRRAESRRGLLLLYFAPIAPSDDAKRWEESLLSSSEVRRGFGGMTCLRVPLNYVATDDGGTPIRLADHPSFAHLHGRPGFAILDFRDQTASYYSGVVSLLPIAEGRRPSVAEVAALADLPSGSLTQRTLIWAVRIHPEAPASTSGRFEPVLAAAAESHSQHQANLRRQGHHNWSARFHQLNARLGRGLVAQEVCAESWPGESLVDAARECVRSWRQSPGHWKAVSSAAAVYAYDLKRGANGIWYATGLFGR